MNIVTEIEKMRGDLETLRRRIEARQATGISEDDPVIARMIGRKVELERALGVIEPMQAEVERLREGDKQADFTSMNLLIEKKIQIEKLEKERDQLKAELERLRVALRQVESNYSEALLELGGANKEHDQLKALLSVFSSVMRECARDCDGDDGDLIPAALWQLWRDSAHIALLHDAEVIERAAKPIATEFFRWWYNQPGSNTDQGFDEWWQLRQQAKEVQA